MYQDKNDSLDYVFYELGKYVGHLRHPSLEPMPSRTPALSALHGKVAAAVTTTARAGEIPRSAASSAVRRNCPLELTSPSTPSAGHPLVASSSATGIAGLGWAGEVPGAIARSTGSCVLAGSAAGATVECSRPRAIATEACPVVVDRADQILE